MIESGEKLIKPVSGCRAFDLLGMLCDSYSFKFIPPGPTTLYWVPAP